MRALRGILPCHGDLAACCAMPRGDAMSPPQLPRDTPVVDILHPVEVGLLVHLRCKADGLVAIGIRLALVPLSEGEPGVVRVPEGERKLGWLAKLFIRLAPFVSHLDYSDGPAFCEKRRAFSFSRTFLNRLGVLLP